VIQNIVPTLLSLMGSNHILISEIGDKMCNILRGLSKQTSRFEDLLYNIMSLISMLGIYLDEEMIERVLSLGGWENEIKLATWIATFIKACKFKSK
jgi:hypothetical protein